ncbi:uncharacterized protein LOC134535215 [Bacillus rossius redtenbacheri]|uniref:uncharacterized protein LOC134535215 n=1 Tax=Bacillus rossius redtenbacheri TaxID=93214 RepID=UPI002FDE0D7A
MSQKKLPGHLKSGWRRSSTNDTDDSDNSSDSDSTVQYIHNFLASRAKSGDGAPSHKSWQRGGLGLSAAFTCELELPHSPFLPAKPVGSGAVPGNADSGSNYHLMHHDYAERMNEQLTRDTFNSDSGDLLNFTACGDVPRSTVPKNAGESVSSNSQSTPDVAFEIPVVASLNLGKCPIKKRPWYMPPDSCGHEAGTSESTNNCSDPSSGRSAKCELMSPSLPQWSYGGGTYAPPLLTEVMSANGVSSSGPSAEVPSSSSQRDRLKLRLKRINLSEGSSGAYTPYTCTLSHSVRGGVGSGLWPRTRDKSSLFPSLSRSPEARAQSGSSSQADPAMDDASSEIQFISMEQPSSAHSLHLSRASDRMKRRKRRKMHLGMLGKTYVSDEVIVVDDSHQEQERRSPKLPYKASVPGPSSHKKLGGITAATTLAHGSSAPDVDVQSRNTVLVNHAETPAARSSSDGGAADPERSTTPDSVVALTPTSEVPSAVVETSPDAGAGLAVTSSSPGQTLLRSSYGTLDAVLSWALSRGGEEAGPAPGSEAPRGPSAAEAVQSGTAGSAACEVKDEQTAGPSQCDDKPADGKPAVSVKDFLKDALFMDTINRLKSKLMSLTAILECPVCLEYVGPPIYQCRRGHIVCGLCKPKLMYCPTCRSGFSEYRNLVAEMFAERLDYPCKNAHLGCDSTFTLKEKEDHEANCAFRFYKCILCPWKGLHRELLPHLVKDHPGKVGHGAEQEILLELGDMTASANQNWIVSAMNEIFRVNFILAKRQSNMQIMGSVQFIGPRRRADDFIYTFEVKSEEFDQHCIFSRKTHSDLDKCYTYYTNGDGFFINNSVLFSSGEEGNKCILVKLVLKKKNV